MRTKIDIEAITIFSAYYVDDGFAHPFEQLLTAYFEEDFNGTKSDVIELFTFTYPRYFPYDDFLNCFAHVDKSLTLPWGYEIVKRSLEHERVGIRDAAAKCLEHWDDMESLTILQTRIPDEPADWLRSYMMEVVQYLQNDLQIT